MYVAIPTFVGMAAARSVDDIGKAAFRPAWASAITDIAAKDPPRKGRRLGTLDAVQEIGEIAGPALAGILWQTGGVIAMFGVRIAIAIVAEISAIAVFGELRDIRPRLRILTWFRKNRRRGGASSECPPARRKVRQGKMQIRRGPLRLSPGQLSAGVPSLMRQGEYDLAEKAYQRVIASGHPRLLLVQHSTWAYSSRSTESLRPT